MSDESGFGKVQKFTVVKKWSRITWISNKQL